MNTFERFLEKNKKTYLIFDFDATLVTLYIDWSDFRKGLMEIALTHGINLPLGPNYYNQAVKQGGIKLRNEFTIFSAQYEADHLKKLIPNEILLEFVRRNKEYKLFIFSSNTKKTIYPILEELEIKDCFESIIASDDVMFRKPNPEGFSLILDSRISKKEYLMIGDSKADRLAAEAAGIDFFDVADLKE